MSTATRLTLLIALGGCGSAPPLPSIELICDGSDTLRLTIGTGGGGAIDPTHAVLWEHGSFLFVQGDCSYWVPQIGSRAQHYRTGTLNSADAAELAEAFEFGRWEALGLVGMWQPRYGDFDIGDYRYYDGQNLIVCTRGCGDESTPAAVMRMRDSYGSWIVRLNKSGHDIDGPLRITATDRYNWPAVTVPRATWPLDWALTDIAVPWEEVHAQPPMFGTSRLISNPKEVVALRAIWDEYLSGQHGELWEPAIPFEDPHSPQVKTFAVVMRDTTPFENERGLIEWPWEARR
ncbi:MAG: hypothetical protein MJD61_09180 [Proteobacteria bacterium]|nr:hypothetical protein [Pseudomonadota bacterium]